MGATERRSSRALSGRIAVGFAFLVAILSVATGIVNISNPTAFGLIATHIPEGIERLAGFTGTLTGFLMVMSALGMRRGLREAWYLTMVLLPVTMVQGLIQASQYSVPLVILSAITFFIVLFTRDRFNRNLSLTTTQYAGAASLLLIQAYGTAGAYALRSDFTNLNTLLDAFYYTLVTVSTVGYGDITPQSQEARLFGLSVLVLGTASFAIALGALLGPAIESRLSAVFGRMNAQIELLEDHIIVLGYGDLTEPILEELSGQVDFIVVTPDKTKADELNQRDVNVLLADPSSESALERVGIEHAIGVVAATEDDAEDALSVLTARQMNPNIRIVVAATDRENVEKLRRAGADT
ncbi:MAG: NAD-binding protein, partial [Halobacteriaceae archaeon]